MKRSRTRLLSLFLVGAMLMSLMPISAFAHGKDTGDSSTSTTPATTDSSGTETKKLYGKVDDVFGLKMTVTPAADAEGEDNDYSTITVVNNGTSAARTIYWAREDTASLEGESSSGRVDGWYYGFQITPPEGATKDAKCKLSTETGWEALYSDDANTTDPLAFWFGITPNGVIKKSLAKEDIVYSYEFDWDGDGTKDQTVECIIDPASVVFGNDEFYYAEKGYTVTKNNEAVTDGTKVVFTLDGETTANDTQYVAVVGGTLYEQTATTDGQGVTVKLGDNSKEIKNQGFAEAVAASDTDTPLILLQNVSDITFADNATALIDLYGHSLSVDASQTTIPEGVKLMDRSGEGGTVNFDPTGHYDDTKYTAVKDDSANTWKITAKTSGDPEDDGDNANAVLGTVTDTFNLNMKITGENTANVAVTNDTNTRTLYWAKDAQANQDPEQLPVDRAAGWYYGFKIVPPTSLDEEALKKATISINGAEATKFTETTDSAVPGEYAHFYGITPDQVISGTPKTVTYKIDWTGEGKAYQTITCTVDLNKVVFGNDETIYKENSSSSDLKNIFTLDSSKTVSETDYVAVAKGSLYKDLGAAITAAAGSDDATAPTVILLKDVELTSDTTLTNPTKAVTLDLYGKKLTGLDSLSNLTNLKVEDRKGGGVISADPSENLANDEDKVAEAEGGGYTITTVVKVTEYTVTFNANYTDATDKDMTAKVEAGKTIATADVAKFERSGYTLTDWATDAEGKDKVDLTTKTFSADTILYAVWTEDTKEVTKYTVTFKSNYDGSNYEDEIVYVESGKAVEDEANFKRPGYTLAGWTTDAEGKTDADLTAAITKDTTFYAKWEEFKPTVTFTNYDGTVICTKQVTYNTAIEQPDEVKALTNEGFKLTGWTIAGVEEGDDSTFEFKTAATEDAAAVEGTPVVEDITVVAQWELTRTDIKLEDATAETKPTATVDDKLTGDELAAAETLSGNLEKQDVMTADDMGDIANIVNHDGKILDDARKAAVEKFKAGDTPVTVADTDVVTLTPVVKLKVEVTGVTAKDADKGVSPAVTLDISATYNFKAEVGADASKTTIDALYDKDQPLDNVNGNATAPWTITIPQPEGFAAGDHAYVKHTKGDGTIYNYKATIDGDQSIVTFENAHGFSTFVVFVDNRTVTIGSEPPVTYDAVVDEQTLSDVLGASEGGWTVTYTGDDGKEVSDTITTSMTVDEFLSKYDQKTLTVTPKEASKDDTPQNNNSHSSGGSSSTTTNYAVSTTSVSNGTVSISPKNAAAGTTVTITPKPNDGYQIGTVTVTDADGNAVTVTATGSGTYTFVMPAKAVTVSATFTEVGTPVGNFTDVLSTDYYADAVAWAIEKGITTGKTSTTFGPNDSCTRGDFMVFLWRAAGSPETTATESFSDVSTSDYYATAIAWAVANGISTGTGDGKFSPSANVSRAEAVQFLWRATGSKTASGSSFSDVASNAYYATAVAWAVANGVTAGTGNNTFSPNANCLRAQIVTFLYQAYKE